MRRRINSGSRNFGVRRVRCLTFVRLRKKSIAALSCARIRAPNGAVVLRRFSSNLYSVHNSTPFLRVTLYIAATCETELVRFSYHVLRGWKSDVLF